MKRYQYRPRSLRRTERKAKRNLILSLVLGFLFLYVLVNWGLPALVGGLSVFNRFKPKAVIQTPVDDKAIAPPVLNIPFEATNTATIKITGYAAPSSKVEVYLDDDLKKTVDTDGSGAFSADSITLALGTNNIYGKTVSEDKKSLPSKTIKLIYSNEKPKLEVSEPADGKEVKGGDKKVRVVGKTDPQNNILVNGSSVIVDNDGNFTTEVKLEDGDNTISIQSTNQVGNSARLERKVKYSP